MYRSCGKYCIELRRRVSLDYNLKKEGREKGRKGGRKEGRKEVRKGGRKEERKEGRKKERK